MDQGPGPLVLYHAECLDGFGAAYAAWRRLGDRAEYRAVRHGAPPPGDVDGRAVYLLDFAYPRQVLEGWRPRVASLEVHDHHLSARDDLEGLPGAHFDMERSGCALAWGRFHPDAAVPPLLAHIEDKDLWRFRVAGTREVIAALRSHPQDFHTWHRFAEEPGAVALLRQEGEAILRYEGRTVQEIVDTTTTFVELAGHRVPAANTSVLASEVANRLLQVHPQASFAAVWCVNARGEEKWSLRSEGAFDVSAIARGFGGGGHRNAAGFVRERSA
ncbi:MAG: hypothetical protein HY722_06280 [Planctomycetes bacterium]|nr:hypothetical protein [Planctomycetota bacterium]